jgi:(2Fe-2S) ferredoxin
VQKVYYSGGVRKGIAVRHHSGEYLKGVWYGKADRTRIGKALNRKIEEGNMVHIGAGVV